MNKKQNLMAGIVLLVAIAAIWMVSTLFASTPVEKKPVSATVMRPEVGAVRFAEGAPQLSMIQAQVIESTPVPIADPMNARVAYDEDLTARVSVSFSGRITALRAATGDSVGVGQVLAEIDSPDFGTATADLNKARADEERKRQLVERAKVLVPGEAISVREWEALQSDYAQAQAERARAELRLKNLNPHDLKVRGQRVSLASPIRGVITERNASAALEVSSSLQAPLFVITDIRRLWLLIDLPERLIGQIKAGDDVAVESDAFPGERFNAKITQVGQLVDPNSRRVTARGEIDNPNRKLLPEMYVRASVLQTSGKGVRVPNTAIINRGIYNFVFVQATDKEFQRRMVKLLTRGSDFSYVGEGLEGGERIVVKGALLLDAEISAHASDKPAEKAEEKK